MRYFNKTKCSISPPVKQKGAVLIIGLLMLLVVTVVTLSSMQGSTVQERMTSNSNNQVIAAFAAEAGASEFLEWIINNPSSWNTDDWQSEFPTTKGNVANLGNQGLFWIEDVNWIDTTDAEVNVGGAALIDSVVVSEINYIMLLEGPVIQSDSPLSDKELFDPAFTAGMLADGNIRINGSSIYTGSVHANGNFRNNGSSVLNNWNSVDDSGNTVVNVSAISAQGSAQFSGSIGEGGAIIPNAPPIPVPSALEYINQNKNNSGVIQSCNIPSGDLEGKIYYCSGNLTISSGSYSNGTIMAQGNITHNGASGLGSSSEATIAIVSGGNITFNGSNTTYGVFWSEGNLVQNGSSVIGGGIVAGGSITRNGSFLFTQTEISTSLPLPENDTLEPEDESSSAPLRLVRWYEAR